MIRDFNIMLSTDDIDANDSIIEFAKSNLHIHTDSFNVNDYYTLDEALEIGKDEFIDNHGVDDLFESNYDINDLSFETLTGLDINTLMSVVAYKVKTQKELIQLYKENK